MVRKRTSTITLLAVASLTVASCGRSNDAAIVDGISITSTTQATVATVPTTVQPPTTQQQTYEVQSGDSLSVIASKFGVETKALADFNAISDVNSIVVGQELAIPPTTAAP